MNKLIRKIALGLAVTSIISVNYEIPTFAASQYYNMKDIKESIYHHLENWDTSFPISYYEKDVLNVIKEVSEEDDYLNMSIIRLEYRSTGSNATVNITYRTTIEQENYVNNELKKAVTSIISPNMSDFEKINAINKYLSNRFEYDYSYASNNAYLALTTGKTTCQGYAMTAYKAFKLAGIENKIIVGTLDGVAHGWNLVKINGEWYHVDITNNDATNSNKYFLKSDDYLRTQGFQWTTEDYPKCYSNYDASSMKAQSNSYWYERENSWYFINNSGSNTIGWSYINGKWYYFGTDGKMIAGWIYDKGNWYYCWSNGEMAFNTTIDGYALNENGAWVR